MTHLFAEYYKQGNVLFKTDARIKLAVAFALLIMILSYRGWIFPLAIVALGLAACFRMKVPFRILLLRFSEPIFIVSVLVLLKLLFSGKDALFSIHFSGISITGYRDGLKEGLLIADRIMAAVMVVAVLGFTTAFTDFMAGLSWFRVPKGLSEIVMFAYRYIFVLVEDAMVIYQAQKNRLGYSTIRRGLSSFGTLAGSLTLRAFDHSQNTTTAMIQRGYDGSMPRREYKRLRFSEIFLSLVFTAIMGVLWKI